MPLLKSGSTSELSNAVAFSLEERGQVAAQLNQGLPTAIYAAENIIRVPRGKNKFDLYVLNQNELLGSGSDCQIYKAYKISDDMKNVGSPIAVKFLARKKKEDEVFVDDEASREAARIPTIEGLKRESSAIKKIGDPLGDFLSTEEGDYLLMPLYQGKKLSDGYAPAGLHRTEILQSATLQEQFDMMFQLGNQVKKMHDNNLMHSDVHPSNMLVNRNEKGRVVLHLIDFDQARVIPDKKNVIVSAEPIKMEFRIRPPEVFEKKVGASADIYALGLNYLFILGHKDPFSKPNKEYVSNQRQNYKNSLETDPRVKKFTDALDMNMPISQREKEIFDYTRKLVNAKFTEEYKELLSYQHRVPLEIGELSNLPIEVDGIPVREIVKNFISSMLNDDPSQRPVIDEVNQFMLGVQVLINRPSNIENSKAQDKWKIELQDPANVMEYKKQIMQIGQAREFESQKLAALIEHLEHIENRIDQHKGFIARHVRKSDDRVSLEGRLKHLAEEFKANPSPDPKKDYDNLMNHLEIEKRLLEPSLGSSKNTNDVKNGAKYKALVSLMQQEKSLEREPELKKSLSSRFSTVTSFLGK